MSNAAVDQLARDHAARALAAIEAHERVCTERAEFAQEQRSWTNQALQRIESAIRVHDEKYTENFKIIGTRLWLFAGALGTGLFGIIGVLATRIH